jgi:hypothetical protein
MRGNGTSSFDLPVSLRDADGVPFLFGSDARPKLYEIVENCRKPPGSASREQVERRSTRVSFN